MDQVKVKAKTRWVKKTNQSQTVKVSRVNSREVFFYPSTGGGAEQRMPRVAFLAEYAPEGSDLSIYSPLNSLRRA